jgi:hypothetical protein
MERGSDASLSKLQQRIDEVTHALIRSLPVVAFDDITGPTTVEGILYGLADPVQPQLIYFSKLLRGLCGVDEEWCSQGLQDMVKTLRSMENIPRFLSRGRLMERQFWRLEDLKSGGFGFTLELYFLSIRRILSTISFQRGLSHHTFLVKTFMAIASDWQAFTETSGTLITILNLVFDMIFHDRGIFSNFIYPDYITKELVALLGRMIHHEEVLSIYVREEMAEIRRNDLTLFDSGMRAMAAEVIQGQLPE